MSPRTGPMNKMHIALATIAITALFIAACGLQGDLYIPSEEPIAAPAGSEGPDAETAEDTKPDQSSEPAP